MRGGRATRRTRRVGGGGHRLRTVTLAVGALILAWLLVTLGPVLAAPGTDPLVARVAEWARDQGFGWAVTAAEQEVYQFTKPQEGGDLAGGIPMVHTSEKATPAPAAGITPLVAPALPGEGQWQPLLTAHGRTVGTVAFLRPDASHTAFSVGVVLLDPSLHFQLHPGTQLPGPVPGEADQLSGPERSTVLATFNSGFRFQDAQGGYWQDGHAVVPLVDGAASMVITKGGRLTVEAWPGGPVPSDVVAVRQNLVPLVDHGRATPEVDSTTTNAWGRTVGNAAFVWRSAVGVRADGSVLVVVGPAMSVRTLADVLVAAGAQTAMELDINKDWTSFITYAQPGAKPTPLTPDEVPSPSRYLHPSSRDFVAVLP